MKNKKRVLGRGLAALLKNPKTDITSNKTNGQNTLVDSISEVLIIKQYTSNPSLIRELFTGNFKLRTLEIVEFDSNWPEITASKSVLGISVLTKPERKSSTLIEWERSNKFVIRDNSKELSSLSENLEASFQR